MGCLLGVHEGPLGLIRSTVYTRCSAVKDTQRRWKQEDRMVKITPHNKIGASLGYMAHCPQKIKKKIKKKTKPCSLPVSQQILLGNITPKQKGKPRILTCTCRGSKYMAPEQSTCFFYCISNRIEKEIWKHQNTQRPSDHWRQARGRLLPVC